VQRQCRGAGSDCKEPEHSGSMVRPPPPRRARTCGELWPPRCAAAHPLLAAAVSRAPPHRTHARARKRRDPRQSPRNRGPDARAAAAAGGASGGRGTEVSRARSQRGGAVEARGRGRRRRAGPLRHHLHAWVPFAGRARCTTTRAPACHRPCMRRAAPGGGAVASAHARVLPGTRAWVSARARPASAPTEPGAHLPDHACSKIFVGGLSSETSENDLKEYFSVYGELTDIVVMRGTCEPCTPASARAPLRAPCASRRGRARAGG